MKLPSLRSAFVLCALVSSVCLAAPSLTRADAPCSHNLAAPCSTNSQASQQRRKDTITALYQGLIYPYPKTVLQNPSAVDNIFEHSAVHGRVTPAGDYPDFEGAIEYFYGLALTPSLRADGIKMRSLTASGDKVAVEVDIHFCRAPFTACNPNVPEGGANHTLRQVGFYTFNKFDRVISFDLAILNLGKATDVSSDAEKMDQIIGVCTVLTTAHYNVVTEQVVFGGTCTSYFDGPEDFPAGFPATPGDALTNCITFMSSLPFGSWNDPHSNTATCRVLHSLLTPLRPIHCEHVSAGGGGECVDHPYSEFFLDEF